MDPATHQQFTARAHVLKALAHPARLFMVDELSRGERCVGDLEALVGSDISTVSKHLTVLKQAGIVTCEKRGAQVFYRLAMTCVTGFFGCVEEVLTGRRDDLIQLTEDNS